jgi:ABC-type nitrate/sulfonate/bicarbonate transport system permease component
MRKDMKEQHPLSWRFLPGIIPGLFLVAWITVSATELIPNYLLPHPLEIAEAGYAYVLGRPGERPYAGRFLSDAGASLFRVAAGSASLWLWVFLWEFSPAALLSCTGS